MDTIGGFSSIVFFGGYKIKMISSLIYSNGGLIMKNEKEYKLIADNLKDMLDSGKSISEILKMSNWKKKKCYINKLMSCGGKNEKNSYNF